MTEIALSLTMLMVFVLPIGAYALRKRGGSNKQVALMLVLAVVMAVNVAIWTVPIKGGKAPVGEQPK